MKSDIYDAEKQKHLVLRYVLWYVEYFQSRKTELAYAPLKAGAVLGVILNIL